MDNKGYQAIRKGSIGLRMKFLLNDSALYGGASAITKLLSLITFPILTRIFSTAEYGAIDAISVFFTLFVAFTTMGQDSAVARFFYETEDQDKRKQLISQALLTEALLCIGVTVFIVLTSEFFASRIIVVPEYGGIFHILAASLPFAILLNFFRNLLKWTFARSKFILLSLGSTTATVLLTVLFVVVLDLGVSAVFYAHLVGMALFALLGMWFCRGYLIWPKNYQFGRRMLIFGWPYMVVGVSSSLIPALDRAFITHFLDLGLMGLYAVGYKLASLLMLPISAFQIAWGPFSLSIYKEENAQDTYNKVLCYYVILISLLIFLIVAAAEPFISLLASSRYLKGSTVVLPLAFGIGVTSIAWITGIGIDLSKKTYWSMLSYFIGLMVSAIVIWISVIRFGILGVSYGIMAGQILQGISYTFFAYRVYPLRYAWKIPCAILLLTFSLCILVQILPLPSQLHYFFFCILLVILLTGLICRLGISKKDRGIICEKLKKIIGIKSEIITSN